MILGSHQDQNNSSMRCRFPLPPPGPVLSLFAFLFFPFLNPVMWVFIVICPRLLLEMLYPMVGGRGEAKGSDPTAQPKLCAENELTFNCGGERLLHWGLGLFNRLQPILHS